MEFHVPTLNSSEAGKKLEETILTSEPNASVSIDIDAQKVTIKSGASPETFKQLIVASGHKIDS
ncbi:MAG: hypothetical protein Tsb0014_39450 [Pleurocapsa sp.]